MGRGKNIDSPVKKMILNAVEKGDSHRSAAAQFGVSRNAVDRLVLRYRATGSYKNGKSTGRPKVTSLRQDRALVKMSHDNPRSTAVDLNAHMKTFYNVQCSVSTTKRRLKAAGLFGRRPAKKPLISPKNRKARIKFAKEHLNWTSEQWAKVLWSDESKFMMFGSDGIRYVRRPAGKRFDPKYQLPTVKHGGGNVLVWGCFSRDGIGPIHKIDGIMDQHMYLDICKNVMLPHAKDKMRRGWIYQQDNDPKHTAKLVKEFFQKKKLRVLDWPSQSPDLNPIENLWERIGRTLTGFKPANKDALFEKISEIWNSISLDVLIKLVDSMPNRCQAVIDAKGYATKY